MDYIIILRATLSTLETQAGNIDVSVISFSTSYK